MGGLNCYAVDHDNRIEVVSAEKPTINISFNITNNDNNPTKQRLESRPSSRVKGRKKKKDIKYVIEIKYSDKQFVNADECFYIKNIGSYKSKKIDHFLPKKIRFNTLIDKVMESNFNEQLKESQDIDKVLDEFTKVANIILKPVPRFKPSNDDPIEY